MVYLTVDEGLYTSFSAVLVRARAAPTGAPKGLANLSSLRSAHAWTVVASVSRLSLLSRSRVLLDTLASSWMIFSSVTGSVTASGLTLTTIVMVLCGPGATAGASLLNVQR